MNKEQARQLLIGELADDYAASLRDDPEFRVETARRGFRGFEGMHDADLVQATSDAGLDEKDDSVWRACQRLLS